MAIGYAIEEALGLCIEIHPRVSIHEKESVG
jgi:hypothetical protein